MSDTDASRAILLVGDEFQPRVIGNHREPRLGSPNLPIAAALSFVVERHEGHRAPVIVAVQGIIQDKGSRIPQRVSFANAVILGSE